ncbi:FCD domain-containing protein [Actinacidiphila sp. bgisy144]|uniref:FCD domain-containing protein n=1 Tax=Actinacidiphila sp. bgisy144 TaxID=3413791 RepID=UPI003EBFD792
MAAGRATHSRHALEEAAAALDAADRAEDAADRSLANRAFHRALYAECGNPLLVTSLDELRDQTALVSSAAWSRRGVSGCRRCRCCRRRGRGRRRPRGRR